MTSRYSSGEMCLDADGNGREQMRADTGASCSGPVYGRFDGAGTLVITQPGGLDCSDGGYIYRLVSRCTLNGDGTVTCRVSQPHVNRSTIVSFRGVSRGN